MMSNPVVSFSSISRAVCWMVLCSMLSIAGCVTPAFREVAPQESTISDAGADSSDTSPDSPSIPDTPNPDGIGPAPVQATNDRAYLPRLLTLLKAAQRRIRIAHLSFYEGKPTKQIEDALIQAKKRGVEVQVLLEDSVQPNPLAIAGLKQAGIDAKLDTNRKMTHLKLVIVDDRWILMGSTNWSTSSLNFNHETNVLIQSPKLVKFYVRYYQLLWGDPGSSVLVDSVQDGNFQAYREGQFTSLVLPLLKTAQKEIRLMLYALVTYTNASADASRLVKALGDAQKRGVRVRVLLEMSDWNKTLNSQNRETAKALKRLSIDTCFDSEKVISHAKLLMIDQSVYTLGTHNWSYSGLQNNHEVGIIVKDDQSHSDFSTYFEQRWKECTPAP